MTTGSYSYEFSELEVRAIPSFESGLPGTIAFLDVTARVPTGVTAKIEVTNLTIIHPFMGDVDVSLTNPDGAKLVLFTGIGGTDAGIAGVTLTDTAATNINTIDNPTNDVTVGGFYHLENNVKLASFGSDVTGTWQLHLKDTNLNDEGSLLSWGIRISFNYLGVVTGNGTGETLDGSNEIDSMFGLGGNDTVWAYDGKDILTGGLGRDTLHGGLGRDIFNFDAIAESKRGAQRDYIADFAHNDDIDLRGIDANKTAGGNQAFSFIGKATFGHHAGELRFIDIGTRCIVQGDVNGDAVPDFEILVKIASMVKGDFLL